MNTTIEISPKEKLLALLEEQPGTHTLLKNSLHEATLEELKHLDFPTTRHEAWKYTSVKPVISNNYTIKKSALSSAEAYKIPELNAYCLVYLNGFFSAELSSISGLDETIIISDLNKAAVIYPSILKKYMGKAAFDKDIFMALNTAYPTGGAFIYLPPGAVLEKPVHIINITENNILAQPRNIIIAAKNSSADVIFSYGSEGENNFTNVVTEFITEENAVLTCYKLQDEQESYHISREEVWQERDSRFSLYTVTLNGSLVRNSITVKVDGENCESNLFGLYLLNGKQHVDNHTVIDHRKPHCNSNEHYKGIMNDNSTGVFNGKVFVRPDAQKTNAFQSNQNILLSDNATINSKPELEIYADDVKCSHGSTTGQFDEDAIFYLRARGISEDSAKNMLVYAFAEEVLEKINIRPLKSYLLSLLEKKLTL